MDQLPEYAGHLFCNTLLGVYETHMELQSLGSFAYKYCTSVSPTISVHTCTLLNYLNPVREIK